jgi:diguanylate cyclase (GGDEF)-like protein
MSYAFTLRIERMMDRNFPRRNVLAAVTGAWLTLAGVCWLSPYELSLDALYLIVIGIAGWYGGWRAGLVFALASTANEWALGTALGHPFSHPAYFLAANVNRLVSGCLVAALAASLKAVLEREHTYARIDRVTGLRNSTGFCEGLQVELARHQREGWPFAVAYVDLDGGGSAHDHTLLQLVASTLDRGLRKTDIIARLGPARFGIMLPKTDLQQSQSTIHQLLDAMRMATASQDYNRALTVGVGVFPETPATEEVVRSFVEGLMVRAATAGAGEVLFETCGTGKRDGTPQAARTAA